MDKLVTYSTPKLAILEQKKKLRDYTEEQKNTITHSLIGKLLDLLGVNDGKIEHHKELHKFINYMYDSYTYEEINEAFQMYVSCKFSSKPYQQLNSVIFGQVMSEYNSYKKEKLSNYRNNQKLKNLKTMSETEKKELIRSGCIRLFNDFKKIDRIEGIYSHIYDYLFEHNLLPKDRLYKDAIYAKAQMVAIYEIKTRPEGKSAQTIKTEIELIKQNQSKDKTILIAKRLVLDEYFRKLIKLNVDIEEEI